MLTGHWGEAGEFSDHGAAIGGLVLGGVIAAPLAGYAVRILPRKVLTAMVGTIILGLAAVQLYPLLAGRRGSRPTVDGVIAIGLQGSLPPAAGPAVADLEPRPAGAAPRPHGSRLLPERPGGRGGSATPRPQHGRRAAQNASPRETVRPREG